jgi:predicted DNA-binding transcriptional regulator AlpA
MRNELDNDQLYDQRGAALFLRVSERTLERWRAERTGPSFIKLSARAVRYRLSSLRAYLDQHQVDCA